MIVFERRACAERHPERIVNLFNDFHLDEQWATSTTGVVLRQVEITGGA